MNQLSLLPIHAPVAACRDSDACVSSPSQRGFLRRRSDGLFLLAPAGQRLRRCHDHARHPCPVQRVYPQPLPGRQDEFVPDLGHPPEPAEHLAAQGLVLGIL